MGSGFNVTSPVFNQLARLSKSEAIPDFGFELVCVLIP